MTFVLIIVFSLLGSVGVAVLSATALLVKDDVIVRLVPRLVSFSTGALLGAAFLGLLPHAAKSLPPPSLFGLVLAGLVVFYLLEKLLLWRHCHKHDCDVHASAGPLLLIGDSLHNFGDGIIIAAAFMASTPLGIVAALSTMAHELPQELGELAVYLHSGYSRRRAFVLNVATSLATLLGALAGYFFLASLPNLRPVVMALSAAGFLYVALADLIPGLRGRRSSLPAAVSEFLLMAGGVLMIYLLAHRH
jgi:zinc and cadmium transporter